MALAIVLVICATVIVVTYMLCRVREREQDLEDVYEDISLLRLQPSGEYVLNYLLPQPGYYAKGWIFDIRGRKLSTLIENESLGTSGTIRWNGLGSDGNRLPAGVYIQYIEMWNAEGKTIRRRAAFLVH